jgi:tRNA pseudouridine55 synthase
VSRRRKLYGRDVHGILLLDKPSGMGSNDALQRVKRTYRANKAGHTGSLDVQATGLLPICMGEATKLSSFLLDSDKHYHAACKLGVITNTGDAAGEQIEVHEVPDFSMHQVKQALEKFRGEINQVPPMFSALKHKGQRLYKLAYQGIEVERKPRQVMIYQLDLLHFEGDIFEINVRCSKGTYIRTLAEDIGRALGCGAHVMSLRRLGAGPFKAEQMVSMEKIEQAASAGTDILDQLLLSMDSALEGMPAVELVDSVAYYLCQGQAVVVPRAPTSGWLRIYDENHEFLGVGEVLEDGRIAPRRLIKLEKQKTV